MIEYLEAIIKLVDFLVIICNKNLKFRVLWVLHKYINKSWNNLHCWQILGSPYEYVAMGLINVLTDKLCLISADGEDMISLWGDFDDDKLSERNLNKLNVTKWKDFYADY